MPPSHLYPPDYRNDIDGFNDDDSPEKEQWKRRAGALKAWAAELAAVSPDSTSRWLEVSMPGSQQKASRYASEIYKRALQLSLAPLLMSCGSGGYRLVIVFDQPVETAHLHALGKRLVRGMHGLGAVNQPQNNADTFRLPNHNSTVWAGETWLSGVDALRAIVNTVSVSPDLLPNNDGKASSESPVQAGQRPAGAKKSTGVQHAVDDDDRDVDEDEVEDELFEIPRQVSFEDDNEETMPEHDGEEEKVTRNSFWIDTNNHDGGGVFVPKWIISVAEEATEMLLLAQLNYWFRQGKDGRLRARLTRDGHLWVAKTYQELGAEICRTSRQVQTAVRGLRRKHLLVVKRHRSPVHASKTVTHFRLDWAALKSAHARCRTVIAKASEPAATNGW